MMPNRARLLWTAAVVVGFAVSLVGCASLGPASPVPVSDLGTVAGTWKGIVYGPGSERQNVDLMIRADGTYQIVARQPIGESGNKGKVVVKDGRLLFEGEKGGHGVGTLQANSAGNRTMSIDAILSDGRTLTAQLSASP
jgi:hypothetical protein